MRLFLEAQSERGKPVTKSANEWIEMNINVDSMSPSYRVRIINDELLGIWYISLETFHFGKWRELYQTEQFYNVEK